MIVNKQIVISSVAVFLGIELCSLMPKIFVLPQCSALSFLQFTGKAFGQKRKKRNPQRKPPKITILTEEYPPFNMLKGSKLTGVSTTIVKLLLKESKIDHYPIQVMPWNRAYTMTQDKPNYALFSTSRTPQREALFQWVGPLVTNEWYLMGLKKIPLKKLKNAKKYVIGGYRGDATAEFLTSKGFELELVRADYLNARKLLKKRIDLWATGALSGIYYCMLEGCPKIRKILKIGQSDMYLALNREADKNIVRSLNKVIQKLRRSGQIRKILRNAGLVEKDNKK